jgi:hypothetical protein
MDMKQRKIALSLLEGLREYLIYAHLNNGSRILDVADLRQYIYEQMGRIRTNAFYWMSCRGTTMATDDTSARRMVTMGKRTRRQKPSEGDRRVVSQISLGAPLGCECGRMRGNAPRVAHDKHNHRNYDNCSYQTVTNRRNRAEAIEE